MYDYMIDVEQWPYSGEALHDKEKTLRFFIKANDFESACAQAQLIKTGLTKNIRVWQVRILAISEIKALDKTN